MNTFKIILGNKNYSSWSLRPWLVLKYTQAAFEEVVIPLYAAETEKEIARYSPSGKVPVLIDGDATIWDSLAIGEYLNEKFPEKNLWPQDSKARATARSICAEMHSGFQSLREAMPMNIRKKIQTPTLSKDAQEDVTRITSLWKSCRENFGKNGQFLFGHFTIADAMHAPIALRFETYQIPLDPTSRAYVDVLLDFSPLQEWVQAAKTESWFIPNFEK